MAGADPKRRGGRISIGSARRAGTAKTGDRTAGGSAARSTDKPTAKATSRRSVSGGARPTRGATASPTPTMPAADGPGRTGFAGFTGIRSLVNPLWCYHGFIGAVLVLCCFGVIMVFSSSTVTLVASGLKPWQRGLNQGLYCGVGLICAAFLARRSVKFYRHVAGGVMIGSLVLQMLTLTPLGVGSETTGNNGWIAIGGFSMQPAEVTKLALCLWLPIALHRSAKAYPRDGLKAYAVPGGMYVAALGLVMLGKDLGTAMILVFIGVVAFLISGFPLRYMAMLAGALGAVVAVLVISSPNRLNRVLAAYQECTDTQGVCFQSTHAKYALASGGLLGVGLGNSREKWNYLPEAHNDFIFAIIGEETGFIGAAIVILLFVVIGWCLISVAMQLDDRCFATSLVCVAVWLVGQALVNIGVVVGIFPVLGVPMPFVSAGGSSMLMCLCAAGVAIAIMRSHPQVRAEGRLD